MSSVVVTAQEPEFRRQEPGVRMRTPAATFEDVGYGDVSKLGPAGRGNLYLYH